MIIALIESINILQAFFKLVKPLLHVEFGSAVFAIRSLLYGSF
jgi:hypothetical protein